MKNTYEKCPLSREKVVIVFLKMLTKFLLSTENVISCAFILFIAVWPPVIFTSSSPYLKFLILHLSG